MKRACWLWWLLVSGCIDLPAAHEKFCLSRPELCGELPDGGPGDDGGCPRSDDFEQGPLHACWEDLEPSSAVATSQLEGGRLVVHQAPNWSWSNGARGFLLYQPITGNFVAQTTATLGRLDGGVGFGSNYAGAGLIAFYPGSVAANQLVSVGTLGGADFGGVLAQYSPPGEPSFFRSIPTGEFSAELRLCRVGADLRSYYRGLDAGTWLPLSGVYDGGLPLPPTLLVGPGAYNVAGLERARAQFEDFKVRTGLTSLTECGDQL